MSDGFVYPEGFFASYHSQKPICGVMAVAVAADVRYEVAEQQLKEAMHKLSPHRQRFGGKTAPAWQNMALRNLGVKFEETIITAKKPQLRNIVETLEKDVVYIVGTPKHVQCIKNGMLIDQGRLAPVATCPQAKKHVNRILKITGKGW